MYQAQALAEVRSPNTILDGKRKAAISNSEGSAVEETVRVT
jgi:hypothetical protein